MLERIKKSREQGFTIIEVMIVLAIAGLIILVVLLAVPAVQRNGRNTAIKNDASALSAGLTEFGTTNSGSMPTSLTQAASVVTFNGGAGTTATTAKVQGSDVITSQTTATAVTGVAGSIKVVLGYSCSGGTTGGTPTAPTFTVTTKSARGAAIIYSNELSGKLQIVCLDS